MSQPVVVDDRDSRIVYSGGWERVTSSSEYMQTKTGASSAGMTASFTFTGTSVSVYGAQGSYDVYGVPVSQYSIDGTVVATYTAPVIQPPYYTYQTLFFQSGTLSADQHELVITNINGTSPSVFWIDFIRYTPATAPTTQAQTPTTTQVQQAPPTTVQQQPDTTTQQQQQQSSSQAPATTSQAQPVTSVGNTPVLPASSSQSSSGSSSSARLTTVSSTSTFVTTSGSQVLTVTSAFSVVASADSSPTSSVAASTSSASSRSIVGPVVGGAIGGLALLLAIIFLLWRCCLRSQRSYSPDEHITPFGSWRNIMPGMREKVPPTMPPRAVTSSHVDPELTAMPALSERVGTYPSRASSPYGSPHSTSKYPRHPTEASISSTPVPPPVLRDHEDSGIRLAPSTVAGTNTVIDVPPAYTRV